MEDKEDRLRAIEGTNPLESSEVYGKEILGKILSKIEVLLK